MNNVTKWMSWEGGVDVCAVTAEGLQMPNLIIHLGRMVNTPVGNAPSGMILWQPEVNAAPLVMGFVSSDEKTGAYFGPNIFAGTPFEAAPVLIGEIIIEINEDSATASCHTGGYHFEVEFKGLSAPYLIDRQPSTMPPFYQQGVEREAKDVTIKINGEKIDFQLPPMGIAGGPAAVVSPNGVYAR